MKNLAKLSFILFLCACDNREAEDIKRISTICDSRMKLASDKHDSLLVILSCDQMLEIAKVNRDVDDANTTAAVAIGIAASANARIK